VLILRDQLSLQTGHELDHHFQTIQDNFASFKALDVQIRIFPDLLPLAVATVYSLIPEKNKKLLSSLNKIN